MSRTHVKAWVGVTNQIGPGAEMTFFDVTQGYASLPEAGAGALKGSRNTINPHLFILRSFTLLL